MNTRKTRSGLTTFLYSLMLVVGLVGCGSGDDEAGGGPTMTVMPPPGGGDGNTQTGSGGMELTLTDGCDDGVGVNYRIFFYSSSTPSTSTKIAWTPPDCQVFVLDGLNDRRTSRYSCPTIQPGGRTIRSWCFGARPRSSSSRYWGLGINGDQSCQDSGQCCRSCPSSGDRVTQSWNLTCN